MRVRKILGGAAIALFGPPLLFMGILGIAHVRTDGRNGAFVSSGVERHYLLYVPKRYDRSKPTSLVISLHGAAGGPAHEQRASGWDRLADAHGFLVVYPAGTEFPRIFPMEGAALTRDVRFIAELIDTLRAHYDIDSTRIYADGLSNGGGMAFALSCTIPDRIAAVGVVAAANLLPFDWCPAGRHPVPVIGFHGLLDPIVPYAGGRTWRTPTPRPFPNIPDWFAHWADRNGCRSEPNDSSITPHVSRRTYEGCADSADVVLYTVQDGGHSWPGGNVGLRWWVGRTDREVDATALMWAFDQAHPLRPR